MSNGEIAYLAFALSVFAAFIFVLASVSIWSRVHGKADIALRGDADSMKARAE